MFHKLKEWLDKTDSEKLKSIKKVIKRILFVLVCLAVVLLTVAIIDEFQLTLIWKPEPSYFDSHLGFYTFLLSYISLFIAVITAYFLWKGSEQTKEQIKKSTEQLKQNKKQLEIIEKDYSNKYLLVLEPNFDEKQISLSDEKENDFPKYVNFEASFLVISNISDIPAHTIRFESKLYSDRKAYHLDSIETYEYYLDRMSSLSILLGHQKSKEYRFGFKVIRDLSDVDKIFIDYQISYRDLQGKKYIALYSYCFLTVISKKIIEPILNYFRLIVDGQDVTSNRHKLITPYEIVFKEEDEN